MFYCKCSQCPDCVINDSSIFKDLLQDNREDLCTFLFLTRFQKKQIVALEDNPSQNIYIAKTGKFKSYKLLDSGKQQIIRFYERGDILNLNSLYEPYYTESVEAVTEAETCTINKVAFESFLERNPKMSFELVKILTKELSGAYQTIRDLGQKNARARVAGFLISYISPKEHENRSVAVPIALSRVEIANMIGVTQETLIRIFGRLKQEKIIEIDNRHVIIKNIPRLLKIAR
jgi:CRP-like cAMP-binding protein